MNSMLFEIYNFQFCEGIQPKLLLLLNVHYFVTHNLQLEGGKILFCVKLRKNFVVKWIAVIAGARSNVGFYFSILGRNMSRMTFTCGFKLFWDTFDTAGK